MFNFQIFLNAGLHLQMFVGLHHRQLCFEGLQMVELGRAHDLFGA
jgi:hypothetical protein